MTKKPINTYRQHVMKLLDRRLGASEPLECAKETTDVLMCWGGIFTSTTAAYDPVKCAKAESQLFKCQLAMDSNSIVKQRRTMKSSIIHQVLTIANSPAMASKFKRRK